MSRRRALSRAFDDSDATYGAGVIIDGEAFDVFRYGCFPLMNPFCVVVFFFLSVPLLLAGVNGLPHA